MNAIHARYPDETPPPTAGSGAQTFLPFASTYRRQVVFPLEMARLAMRTDVVIHDRAARVAIAIERFRRDAGALPMRLEELVPAYLSSIPRDPWTGRALIYQSAPASYVVYSVGANLQDDDGALMQVAPPTSAARYVPGGDIGVRVLRRPVLTTAVPQPDVRR